MSHHYSRSLHLQIIRTTQRTGHLRAVSNLVSSPRQLVVEAKCLQFPSASSCTGSFFHIDCCPQDPQDAQPLDANWLQLVCSIYHCIMLDCLSEWFDISGLVFSLKVVHVKWWLLHEKVCNMGQIVTKRVEDYRNSFLPLAMWHPSCYPHLIHERVNIHGLLLVYIEDTSAT